MEGQLANCCTHIHLAVAAVAAGAVAVVQTNLMDSENFDAGNQVLQALVASQGC